MRAIRIHEHGGPEVLRLEEVNDPVAGPGQVVVRVAAVGLNFLEIYQRNGLYPIALPAVLGNEGAGEVVAVGEGVEHLREGDLVGFVDVLCGAYAEQVAIAADRAVRVPDGVGADLAAAVLLQGMTAHYLTHSTYPLGADDTALVYSAAGGVGRLLVQLAKRRGARVIACTSTEEKAEEVRRLGADEVVLYRDEPIAERVRELTGGAGVQVVYDAVGVDTFEASLASLAPRGLLVLYGQSSGPVAPFDLQRLAGAGSLYVTRPTLFTYIATHDELAWRAGALFELIRSGDLDLRIHDRYPLEDVARAHADLASGTTLGKLLLEIG